MFIRGVFGTQPVIRLAKSGLSILVIILSTGCAARPLDPWTDFMDSVMESAGTADVDTLTRDWTLYRWEDIIEFYQQASVVDVTRGQARPAEEQLYDAMRKDVQLFVRSYEDLFKGRPVACCTKRLEIEGVDCYSVILWVRRGKTYSGILIHAVWKRPTGFKVLEWVDTASAVSAGVELWKKRARLRTQDPTACIFPDRIEFERIFRQ